MTERQLPAEHDATAISDHLLEKTGDAYLARDFEAFSHWFHLPHLIGTFDGDRLVSTREELAATFEAMCAHFETLGVIGFQRKTLEARFVDTDTVQATFSSRYLLRNHIFGEEVVAHGLLKRIEDQWKVTEGRYATENTATLRALQTKPV